VYETTLCRVNLYKVSLKTLKRNQLTAESSNSCSELIQQRISTNYVFYNLNAEKKTNTFQIILTIITGQIG